MIEAGSPVVAGATGLGLLHGLEPGHGWPLAASYGLARANRYAAGLAASVVLGIGHLISSIAVVLAFFGVKEWFALGGTAWIGYVAGGLLIALGLWEVRPGHAHGHGHGHSHGHGHNHAHGHSHVHGNGHDHRHHHGSSEPTDRGLWGIAGAAFALGFVHEEEFEIIGLCAGSHACLAVMLIYALAVVAAIVAPTLVMIYGFQRFRHRLDHLAPHLPKVSGAILIVMGAGFLTGVL